jgi:hypothetical protein
MRGVGSTYIQVGGSVGFFFFGFWEREGEEQMQGDKIFFFTCPLRVQGKKKTYGIVQNDTVYFFLLSFFFFLFQ